ncbi:hypothetical protein ASE67_09535 [Sphingomonas sp. Leaf23]|uniref:class I SAM-dependent methyltransferase n=1 Tax=Sphingomonas sp. Leaf23 TaxID=1735689 RepID=UPI0006F64084|nr:class I SAM-dependent methyltransferase [Sphingomonas sp. Leaf23]KQM86096.1 hypothetical protein ASE67_09535 [Sphingomonas sp. Leaf23]
MADPTGLARQLAAPSGLTGRLVGGLMDIANRKPLRHSIAALAPRVGEHVLDLGAGTGAGTAQLLRVGARVTAIDHAPLMVATIRRRFRPDIDAGQVFAHQGDFAALPIIGGSVDAVLAVNTLYFWHRPKEIIGELRRVLRPGGRFVAYVTDAATMTRWGMDRAATHRLYDAAALLALATAIAPDGPPPRLEPITTLGAGGFVLSVTLAKTATASP